MTCEVCCLSKGAGSIGAFSSPITTKRQGHVLSTKTGRPSDPNARTIRCGGADGSRGNKIS
jgi:hypothetical protein